MTNSIISTDGTNGKPAAYPKRPSHFAHKVTRLLAKTGAASEIGAHAVLLVVVIVHAEDARRYTGPVTFFNDQLYEALGVSKWKTLNDARRKAVEAGWIIYWAPPQGKRQAGTYQAAIPQQFDGMGDSAIDEGAGQESVSDLRIQSEETVCPKGIQSGIQLGIQSGATLYPTPDPIRHARWNVIVTGAVMVDAQVTDKVNGTYISVSCCSEMI